HGNYVESVTLQGNQKSIVGRRIEQPPSLHFAGSHVQGGVSDPVSREIEESSPRRAVQPICAPGALNSFIVREERKRAELLRFFVDICQVAILLGPNDLKTHDDVFGRGNLGNGIERSGSSFDDQK